MLFAIVMFVVAVLSFVAGTVYGRKAEAVFQAEKAKAVAEFNKIKSVI
jgi:hypothetical protein